MAEVEDEGLDLHRPLEILRTTTKRLLERQIPATSARLDEIYAHLSGAVGDVLDAARQKVVQAVDLARDNLGAEELEPESEAAETLQSVQHSMTEAGAEIEAALEQVKASFFSAKSFAELQERLPNLTLFEARLEGAMLRLEEALMIAGDPELFPVSSYVPSPTLSDAVEALAQGLDELSLHMREGDKEALQRALEAVRRAEQGLTAALAD
jgi:flagellar motor protein MotB